MQVIDQINGSALFAQSAYSASIATKDNLGRDITATYLTGINLPESAKWNEATSVVQTNSSVWNDKLDVSSLDLAFGNPVDFGYGITGAYKISGADILANYALADSQGRYITGWYQLKDDNLLSGTKYGTLRIDNENTHLVDTTFSALSSYNGIEISAIPESGVGFYNGGMFPDNTKSTTSHNYDNVLSYSINIQSWDGGFTAQINGTNYDHSYFDGSHTITGEFNTPSTLNVKLSRGNNYMNPQINQFDLGVAGQVNEVVDIRNVFATTGDLTSKQDTLTFGYDEQDRISAINNSALAGGGDVPEDVMVEPNLEYNAVGEISGYGNSAIAQYGAEKQWLVHDDTLVHLSNSAQYALGVNLSAVAQLMSPKLNEPTFAGFWNGREVKQMLLTGTFYTNVNSDVIPLNEAYSACERKWIDPSNSFIFYGSSANVLPTTWVLGATNRLGSLTLLNGIVRARSNDTAATNCTAFVTIKWCEN